ncbi:uncharacterized protein EDB93DRAFT_1107146 [Suillus bovinus]|uniref:uncharacterized protein n=1 Tax=Suillus bovinus TaxID=48563 RepID=UPI001B86702E|nr:uncharacterized protein EDB93DRAFT_1107146 [Suillus bovinus]KAG2135398.1 hypothetical protein EDB93DRAFT_1107146 [Suillus bovinus]
MSCLRHILLGIAEHYHLSNFLEHITDDVLHSQLSHTADTGNWMYTRGHQDHPQLTNPVIHRTIAFCDLWHELLGFKDDPPNLQSALLLQEGFTRNGSSPTKTLALVWVHQTPLASIPSQSYYSLLCNKALEATQPWSEVLMLIGMLLIPRQGNIKQLCDLFAEMLSDLLNGFVQIDHILFPDEYLQIVHPTPTEPAHLTYHDLLSTPQGVIKTLDDWMASTSSSYFDPAIDEFADQSVYNYWGTTIASTTNGLDELEELFTEEPNKAPYEELALSGFYPSLAQRDSNGLGCTTWIKANSIKYLLGREVKGSSWRRVGEYLNSFKISPVDVRHLISKCFLTVLNMVSKDYQQMLNEPDGFNLCQLKGGVEEGRERCNVAMLHTNFGGSVSLGKRIKDLVTLFNSSHLSQEAIFNLIINQVFRELLWASLLHPVSDLADGRHDGCIANLFPEQIMLRSNCLVQKPTGNLMTLIYQLMYNGMKDEDPGSVASFHSPDIMNAIMSALNTMYTQPHRFEAFTEAIRQLPFLMSNNVLPIGPKTGIPRPIEKGKAKMCTSKLRGL